MNIEVKKVYAFSTDGQGGNPAGVVLEADQLSQSDKQTIAAKVGLSETAFVSHSESADFKLEFFTPNRQIAHCGHATIATFSYLKANGLIAGNQSSKETIDGNRKIFFEGEMAFMEQVAPVFKDVNEDQEEILNSLEINSNDLSSNSPLEIVNTGNSFLIVAVKNEKILKGIKPVQDLILKYSEKHDLIGYYIFAASEELDATTRMFAPRYGIEEEPATGMAAGPLAAYLFEYGSGQKEVYHFAQGEFMPSPSPSKIDVKLEFQTNKISKLFAGGHARVGETYEVSL